MAGAGGTRVGRLAQLAAPAGAVTVATLENVWLAFDPRVVMAAMHTTMMSASMTAYSTAVGPSSFFTNSTNVLVSFRMTVSETGRPEWGGDGQHRFHSTDTGPRSGAPAIPG